MLCISTCGLWIVDACMQSTIAHPSSTIHNKMCMDCGLVPKQLHLAVHIHNPSSIARGLWIVDCPCKPSNWKLFFSSSKRYHIYTSCHDGLWSQNFFKRKKMCFMNIFLDNIPKSTHVTNTRGESIGHNKGILSRKLCECFQ